MVGPQLTIPVMLTLICATTFLVLFYGLAWHNQPANQREGARQGDNQSEELRAALGLKRPKGAARRRTFTTGQSVVGESNRMQAIGTTNKKTILVQAESLENPVLP